MRIFLRFCFILGLGWPTLHGGLNASPLLDTLKNGIYRGEIQGYKGNTIPFQFKIQGIKGKKELILINAQERLKASQIRENGDSIWVTLPFFDADLRFKVESDHWEGYWTRYLPSGNRRYPILARKTNAGRFLDLRPPKVNISGLWDIHFKGQAHTEIGEFDQDKWGRVTGSILSITGDYRYLEGNISGDSLYLSTFDGAHAYLFKARLNNKTHSLDNGQFYAASNPPEFFMGQNNPRAQLEDVYTITKLKPGLDTLSFHFKNLKGEEIQYPDADSRNKITLIQFFGSWCPNCMDETAFLTDFYKKHSADINIIGLAYERSNDWMLSRNSVQRFADQFHIPYTVLVTGFKNQNEEVMKSLPALANYEGFPTLIIIDKKGKVQKVHTGFSGPGTGKYYSDFVAEFNDLFKELNAEN